MGTCQAEQHSMAFCEGARYAVNARSHAVVRSRESAASRDHFQIGHLLLQACNQQES